MGLLKGEQIMKEILMILNAEEDERQTINGSNKRFLKGRAL